MGTMLGKFFGIGEKVAFYLDRRLRSRAESWLRVFSRRGGKEHLDGDYVIITRHHHVMTLFDLAANFWQWWGPSGPDQPPSFPREGTAARSRRKGHTGYLRLSRGPEPRVSG
jgi:hypothetical protein